MESDAIAALLAKPLHAVLGINRPDRPPQLSVVWFEWDGTSFRFSTKRSRAKVVNLSRDPRISVLVDDPETNTYVAAFGTAQIDTAGHADLSRRLFTRYLPGIQPSNEPEDPDRVVVTLSPDRLIMGS